MALDDLAKFNQEQVGRPGAVGHSLCYALSGYGR